jgi:hypothetical protein
MSLAGVSSCYTSYQQAQLFKKLLNSDMPGDMKVSIFSKMNTDVFSHEPSLLSDVIQSHIYSKISQTIKPDISDLLSQPDSDIILLDEEGLPRHGYLDAANDRIAIRERKNADIEELLSGNGIKISDGENFSFTVDSKTLNVTVSGENNEKAKKIESVLNNNKFGKDIISTANQACLRQEEIATHIQMRKYNANKSMQYKFGCSLDDITFDKDGTPYLPSGQSVADALSCDTDTKTMLASGDEITKVLGNASVEAYMRPLRDIYNAGGADSISDFTVSIDYDKTGYIDTVTDGYGFGKDQLAWYDKLKSLRGNTRALLAYGATIFN